MKNLTIYSITVLLAVFSLTNCKEKITGDLILSNINIVNSETGEIEKNKDVIIVNDRISSIIPSNRQVEYEAKEVIDASGKFLIPGLWDMHVHLSKVGETSLPLFVLNGVTGVRDMGGDWTELNKIRKIGDKTNEEVYPKIKTAGPILESPQFYGLLKQILGSQYVKDRIAISSKEQAKQVVDSLSNLGVDLIKVRTVMSAEIFEAIASASDSNNIPFTGHIDQNIAIDFAVENNIQTIEHDLFLQTLKMDNDEIEKTLESINESNAYFTPTLIATYNSRLRARNEIIELINDSSNTKSEYNKYLDPKLIEEWRIQMAISALESPMNWDSLMVPLRSYAKSITENTTVLAGTDTGVQGIIPGTGLHRELELMVSELGLSNLEVLQAATINPVKVLKLSTEYGHIKENYKADLLVLNQNPLDDISNTKDIFSVVKNGNMIDIEEIQERLKQLASNVKKKNTAYQAKTLEHLTKVLNQMKATAN